MKKLFPVFAIAPFLFSCGGTEETTNDLVENQDSTQIDSMIVETIEIEVDPNRIVIDVDELLAKSEETFELPLVVDSAFVSSYVTNDEEDYNLSMDEAKYMSFDFVENDITSMADYIVPIFIRLDSLKVNGGYDDYQSTLDIGGTRYSNGNVIGKVEISEQSIMLLWTISYATYEACPYGQGTYVYGTVFTNSVGTNTALIAELSGGGDPPAWGDTKIEAEINDSTIVHHMLDRWGEEDWESGEEIVEVREKDFTLKITPYGLKAIKGE
jgi:hypothetical protein